MTEPKDHIYSKPLADVTPFSFNNEVADVFHDMAQRSIPGYASAVELAGILAAKFAQPDSSIYDLGCSLGATTASISTHLQAPGCQVIALDSSSAMIERAQEHLANLVTAGKVQCQQADIRHCDFKGASVVVSNFTLQFLDRKDRQPLINKIFSKLHPQGAFLLAEKICYEAPEEEALQQLLHQHFKQSKAYSDLEITQKRKALEGVMQLDSKAVHEERLRASGFSTVSTWFQCLNFIGLIALPQKHV